MLKNWTLWKRFHKASLSTRETAGHAYPRISAHTAPRVSALKKRYIRRTELTMRHWCSESTLNRGPFT